jgi:Na+-transporting NADH:ubiquinone oxidoreductase subunit NqrE
MDIMVITIKVEMHKTNKVEQVPEILNILLEVLEQLYLQLEVTVKMEQEGNLEQEVMIVMIQVQEVNHLVQEVMTEIAVVLGVLLDLLELIHLHIVLHHQEVQVLEVMVEVDHLEEVQVVEEDLLAVAVEEEDNKYTNDHLDYYLSIILYLGVFYS